MTRIVTPTEFRSSIALTEDYQQSRTPPLAADLRSRFVTLQRSRANSLKAELLSVTAAGDRVAHFERDHSSASGWKEQQFDVDGAPQGRSIMKLLGFYESDTGYTLAFFPTAADSGTLQCHGMQRGSDGQWRHMPLSPDLENAFGQVREADTFELADGRQVVYAVSTNFAPPMFVMAVLEPGASAWSIAFMMDLPSPASTFALLPGWGDDAITVATFEGTKATFRRGSFHNGQFEWGNGAPIVADFGIPLSSRQVFPVAKGRLEQGFFLRTAEGQLLRITGLVEGRPVAERLTHVPLSPQAVSHVSVGVDADQRVMLFATDANDSRLWLLREKPASIGATRLEPWVPLGNTVSAVVCPAQMSSGAELFLYDLGATVQHLAQEPVQGCWFTQAVRGPTMTAESPAHISSYALQVNALAPGNVAVPAQVIEITSDRLTSLTVNGLVYAVDPATPIRVETDASGRLTLGSVASALSSPTLDLKAMGPNGLLFSKKMRADEDAHRRLAGEDPNFPVTGAVLKDRDLVPKHMSDQDADRAAKTLRDVSGAAVESARRLRGEPPRAVRTTSITRISFAPGQAPVLESLGPQDWILARTSVRPGNLDFELSDIFGDVANFLKNAIAWLEDIVVKVADEVVEVVLTIGSAVRHFLLDSIDKISDFLELFFAKLAEGIAAAAEAIRKAIDWLRQLFGWEDILLTAEAMNALCTKTLDFVKESLDERLPTFLEKQFKGWRAGVERAFDEAEKKLVPGLNFDGLVPTSNQPFAAGGPPLLAVYGSNVAQQNRVRCDFVRSQVLDACAQGTATLRLPDGNAADAGLLDEFIKIFETAFPREELERSAARMRAMANQIQDARSFIEVALAEILEAFKDLMLLVLAAIEALLLAFCKLAAAAIGALEALITAVIDIPVLSGLYKEITGHDLTLLHLFSLLIAVPTTILYKLVYGGRDLRPPFTRAEVDEIKRSTLPWPNLFGAEDVVRWDAPVAVPDWLKTTLKVALVVSSIGYCVFDIGLDVMAALQNAGFSIRSTTIPGVLSVLSSLFVQMAGAPWTVFFDKTQPEWNEADKWAIANWAMLFLPVITDTGFLIFSPQKAIQRFSGKVGSWISCVEGVAILATGIGAAVEMGKSGSGYNSANQAAALLPAFPYIAQPVVICGLDPTPKGAAVLGTIVVVDLVGDIGSAIAGASA